MNKEDAAAEFVAMLDIFVAAKVTAMLNPPGVLNSNYYPQQENYELRRKQLEEITKQLIDTVVTNHDHR